VSEREAGSVRAALKSAINKALKRRDRQAAAVYRAALGAIDNAEAVPADGTAPAGAIGASAVGVGRTDMPRRALSEPEMRAIVRGEADERRAAADLIETREPSVAERLRAEATLLLDLLGGLGNT